MGGGRKMTGFHPSGNGRGAELGWRGRTRGEGWHFPSTSLWAPPGTCPLGGAGAEPDSTSSGRRHFNSLCTLSPREAKSLAQEGRKPEHIP